jgi:TolB-like protein
MSSDKEQEYFSDGLSEELLNQLAQIPQLRVIARTSSFSFKGKELDVSTIAKALNVANVLEGSVRRSANTLRVTAQLIRASDSSHLWSQTYDRDRTDIFKVQDEIAADVVALKVKLLPTQELPKAPRTNNPEAAIPPGPLLPEPILHRGF